MSRFGFSTEPSAGGDFLPVVKYDARAGRIARVDRINTGTGFASEPVDITDTFKALMDLENLETGWILFSQNGPPDFNLVPMGHLLPPRPTEQHKNGVRLMLKLTKECGGEKPIREIAGTAKAFLSGLERLYDQYDAQKATVPPGHLPIVVMKGSTPLKSTLGTNYVPKFEIVGWAPRGDLVFVPKGGAVPQQVPANVPPSTGSTKVDPPAAAVSDDDFG